MLVIDLSSRARGIQITGTGAITVLISIMMWIFLSNSNTHHIAFLNATNVYESFEKANLPEYNLK
jgi:hypothetical protein